MKFTAELSKFEDFLWDRHIIVPEEFVETLLAKKVTRIVCNINQELEFQCAIRSKGDGRHFIVLNKEIRKKLGLEIGTSMNVEIREDTSKYGLPMPEEMEALLELDDEGDKFFHALTPGKQRTLLHLIGKPKSTNKRMEKAVIVIDYLKATNGRLDFKELNQAFKDAIIR